MSSESHSITIDIEPYQLRIVKNHKNNMNIIVNKISWSNIIEVTMLIYKNTININNHDYYSYTGFICFKQDRDYFTASIPHYDDQKLIQLLIENKIIQSNDYNYTIYLTNTVLLKLL